MRTRRRGLMIGAAVPLLLAAGRAAPDPATALAGRYDREFLNGLVTGEKYTGQHIVEIVPVAPRAAYVRINLDYFNGHSCDIFGVARAEGDALVYREPEAQYDGTKCVLRVSRAGKSLVIDDGDATCKSSCGMRGTLSEVKIPYASRRPIRYLARLKGSAHYRSALAEWRARGRVR